MIARRDGNKQRGGIMQRLKKKEENIPKLTAIIKE